MKITSFTPSEISELEAFEIKGGFADGIMAQGSCANGAEDCGVAVDQENCSNNSQYCGGNANQGKCTNTAMGCGSQKSCTN